MGRIQATGFVATGISLASMRSRICSDALHPGISAFTPKKQGSTMRAEMVNASAAAAQLNIPGQPDLFTPGQRAVWEELDRILEPRLIERREQAAKIKAREEARRPKLSEPPKAEVRVRAQTDFGEDAETLPIAERKKKKAVTVPDAGDGAEPSDAEGKKPKKTLRAQKRVNRGADQRNAPKAFTLSTKPDPVSIEATAEPLDVAVAELQGTGWLGIVGWGDDATPEAPNEAAAHSTLPAAGAIATEPGDAAQLAAQEVEGGRKKKKKLKDAVMAASVNAANEDTGWGGLLGGLWGTGPESSPDPAIAPEATGTGVDATTAAVQEHQQIDSQLGPALLPSPSVPEVAAASVSAPLQDDGWGGVLGGLWGADPENSPDPAIDPETAGTGKKKKKKKGVDPTTPAVQEHQQIDGQPVPALVPSPSGPEVAAASDSAPLPDDGWGGVLGGLWGADPEGSADPAIDPETAGTGKKKKKKRGADATTAAVQEHQSIVEPPVPALLPSPSGPEEKDQDPDVDETW